MVRSFPARAARALVAAVDGVFRPSGAHSTPAMHERLEPRRLMSVNVSTYHYSNAETGANTNETALTLADVNTTAFGKVASMAVDGQIYTQPLVMTNVAMAGGQGTHDVVFVATENDTVYAFDAYGNNPAAGYLWKTSLLQTNETAVPESVYGTTDITPKLGVTGTPVIDPATGYLYVVGLFQQTSGSTVTGYSQRIYALNITSGANAIAPVTIAASVSGSTYNNSTYNNPGGVVTFSAFRENQRPALTLANGEVYVGWASHGDQNPWHGWAIAYNAATLHQDYAYCTTLNGQQGGIWMSGGGLAVDSSGNLYFTTGNGDFNASSSSNLASANFSMSIEKLSPTLTPIDFFAPKNESSLSGADLDYGCSNVIILTNQSTTAPNELLSAGKWGTIFLNNSDTGKLGEFNTSSNADLGEANLAGASLTTSNVHNTLAYWNGNVYLGGDALTLQAFNVANGVLGTTPSSVTSKVFGTASAEDGQGAGITVSSNGASNGIVWALDNSGFLTSPAVLYAYNASNLGQLLWNSSQAANSRDTDGIGIKFQDPVVANGYVYTAGFNSVTVYGLITTSTATPTIVTPAAASPSNVTTTTTNLSVLASDPSPDLAPTYTWAASNLPTGATAPTFSVNGTNAAYNTTATFSHAGTYTFTVTAQDPNSALANTSSVTVVVNQTFSGLTITPNSASVSDGATQQFTASATDQFGVALTTQPTVTWSVNTGGVGGTINSTGLYTAPSSGGGNDTVTATTGTFTATAPVAVAIPTAYSIVDLSSYFDRIGIVRDGTRYRTNQPGLDGGGYFYSSNLLGTTQTWNNCTFNIGTQGVNDFVYGAGQVITLPQVRDGSVQILACHINGSAQDTFTVTYTDGTTSSIVQGISDWYTPGGFPNEGNAVSMAYRDYQSGSKDNRTFYLYGYSLAVDPSKTVQSITLPTDSGFDLLAMDTVKYVLPYVTTPAAANPSPVIGNTAALGVSAIDPTGDAPPVYTWAATNVPTGATTPTFGVNNTASASATTATFYQAGTYTFTVTIKDPTNSLTTSSAVTVVVNQTPTSTAVSPVTTGVYDGRTQQFIATAKDQFGAALASQPAFTWSVNVGGVGGTVNATGLYTAPATGTGADVVTATGASISGTATVTVATSAPTVTTAAAVNPSPVTGTTATLTVLGTDIPGDGAPVYNWVASNTPAGATTPTFAVNNSASANASSVTFYKAGAYTFIVTITDPTNGRSATSSVNVTVNQTLTTITVSPAGPVSLVNGQSQQFTAAGFDQFGLTLTTQPTFTWSVVTGTGTVSGAGLYQAAPSGTTTATVQASSGSVSATAVVQVGLPAWLAPGSGATWNSTTKALTVTGPTTIIADPGTDLPLILANGSSAAVTVNPATGRMVEIGGYNLSNGATIVMPPLAGAGAATPHRVLVVGQTGSTPVTLVDSVSSLDLTDNDMDVIGGSLTTLGGQVARGFNGGAWNSAGGITSSTAAADSTHLTTLGMVQNNGSGTALFSAANPFDGVTPAASDVLVRYTYAGDANLDGKIDGSDYSLIDAGFSAQTTGWQNGDFNFDGTVDGSDYSLIDNGFNRQAAPVSTAALVATPATIAATTVVTTPAVHRVAVQGSPVAVSVISTAKIVATPAAKAVTPPVVGTMFNHSKVRKVAFSDVKILSEALS